MTAISRARQNRSIRYLAIGIGLALVLVIAVLATRKSADSVIAPSTLSGKPAPELNGKTIDGKPFSLSSYRGKVVVLNYFASWCIPCKEEHDDLLRFNETHASTGDAALAAVLFNDNATSAREFFAKQGGDWPVMVDQGTAAIDYGVRAPPETFVIDKDGYVRQKFVGAVRYNDLEETVNALNAEAAQSGASQ